MIQYSVTILSIHIVTEDIGLCFSARQTFLTSLAAICPLTNPKRAMEVLRLDILDLDVKIPFIVPVMVSTATMVTVEQARLLAISKLTDVDGLRSSALSIYTSWNLYVSQLSFPSKPFCLQVRRDFFIPSLFSPRILLGKDIFLLPRSVKEDPTDRKCSPVGSARSSWSLVYLEETQALPIPVCLVFYPSGVLVSFLDLACHDRLVLRRWIPICE